MRWSPHRLPHTTLKPLCDKPSFWMTSNYHFQNKFHLFINQNLFWMIHHNDHFIFKTMRLFVGSEFYVSHRRLCNPRHFYGLSPLATMSDHNWPVFHSRGDLSFLADTRHIFSLPFSSIVQLYWTLSHLTKPNQSNTKRNVNSLTMHSHTFNAMNPCICNAIRHCMLYHVTCMVNATWNTQSTPLTDVMDNHITCI